MKGSDKPTYDLRNIGVDGRRFARNKEESTVEFLARCLSNLDAYGGRVVIDLNVDGVNLEYMKTWFAGTLYQVTDNNKGVLFVGIPAIKDSFRPTENELKGSIPATVAAIMSA